MIFNFANIEVGQMFFKVRGNAMNILVLTGSPRKNGNSEMLADAFIKGAKAKGHAVNKFNAGTKVIGGCKACDTCWSKGNACSFKDDFAELEPLLEQADMIVYVSPVYWWAMTAQIKAAIDRMYAYGSDKALRPLKIKKAALLLCAEDTDQGVFGAAVESHRQILGYLGWESAGMILVPGVHGKGDIEKTGALKKAEDLGLSL